MDINPELELTDLWNVWHLCIRVLCRVRPTLQTMALAYTKRRLSNHNNLFSKYYCGPTACLAAIMLVYQHNFLK